MIESKQNVLAVGRECWGEKKIHGFDMKTRVPVWGGNPFFRVHVFTKIFQNNNTSMASCVGAGATKKEKIALISEYGKSENPPPLGGKGSAGSRFCAH